ncbi:MAG: response regulator transcription factor [Gemmatimonadetes bacterium]|nr:response regulator transcription factor [Gemmatimonadota bacterium]
MRPNRVLVVEDDPAMLRGLTTALRAEGYELMTAERGDEALKQLRGRQPDLVLLDVMIPVVSGFEVCRTARAEGIKVPIIMLTARGLETDRVSGLDLGADDYVTKPFSLPELLARVRALLRRTHPADELPGRLEFDDVAVDFEKYECTRAGQHLQLSPKEYGVLRLLAARHGEVVSRAELLDRVWGYESCSTTRTVDTHVATLRAKLGDDSPHPRRLLTVHGVGYRLDLTKP